MFIHNGTPFDIAVQHTIGNVQYPPGYFRNPAARAAAGITEVADPVRPDDRYHFVTQNSDGTFTATPRDIEQVKAQKRADIAASRYALEVAGVTVAGSSIATDRESQAMLSGALLAVGRNQAMLIDWKNTDGTWSKIDKPTVEAIADVVTSHVQACFTAERARCLALAALTDFSAVVAFDTEVAL